MDMDLFSKLILVKRQMEDYEERGINRCFMIYVFASSFRFSSQKNIFQLGENGFVMANVSSRQMKSLIAMNIK